MDRNHDIAQVIGTGVIALYHLAAAGVAIFNAVVWVAWLLGYVRIEWVW